MKDKKEKKKKTHKDEKRSERKIRKKAKKKEKKKREKRLKEQIKSAKKAEAVVPITKPETPAPVYDEKEEDCGPSIDLMNRAKCPETKEQWDKRQSQIKRVVDPETGRTRLIKGDGEILEEMVTKNQHKQINKDATRNDGKHYQRNSIGTARKYQ